jgi:hypothetical protein
MGNPGFSKKLNAKCEIMNKTVTIIVVLFLMSFAVHAQDMYTVHPQDTGAALVNPAMGWTMHFYSNVTRNYGSKLALNYPGFSMSRQPSRVPVLLTYST